MLCGKTTMIRLCWIFGLFVSLVQCQFGNGGFGGKGFEGGPGRFGPPGAGFGVGPPFPNGGFSGGGGGGGGGGFNRGPQGFQSRPNRPSGEGQNEIPEQVDEEQGQTPEESSPAPVASSAASEEVLMTQEAVPSSQAVPSPTVVESIETLIPVIDANGEMAIAPPERSSFVLPLSSLRAAIPSPEPETLQPLLSTNAGLEPSTLIGAPAQATSTFVSPGSLSAAIPSPAVTITMTTSMTVLVTPTPVSPPATAAQDEQSAAADSTASPTSTPVPASASASMSPSARAGMGVGVTLGIIGLASVTGLYLWRRRKNKKFPHSGSPTGGTKPNLGRFLMLHRGKNTPTDTEWSIESAEKVEIVRGANARTVSRSDSTSNPPTRDGVLKVGMTFEAKRDAHPALTSNPPSLPEESMLSPSAFPKPPTGTGKGNGNGNGGQAGWPLSG